MPSLPAIGIRTRLLVLGVLPVALIVAAVLAINTLRMRSVLLGFGEQRLLDRARAVAAEIDRDVPNAGPDRLGAELDAIRRQHAAEGWHAELFLVGPAAGSDDSTTATVIATTVATPAMRGRPAADTPYASVLASFHGAVTPDRVVTLPAPRGGGPALFAAPARRRPADARRRTAPRRPVGKGAGAAGRLRAARGRRPGGRDRPAVVGRGHGAAPDRGGDGRRAVSPRET